MSNRKPIASLSLDLDNQWSYLKIHGNPAWRDYPSYLELAVPRILRVLAEEELRISFFVVGKDATLPRHRAIIRQIADAGHEIANHSFDHESWLHRYSEEDIHAELTLAHDVLADAAGSPPRGFRGPGFSVSRTVLKVVRDLGYDYDASTWPTFLGPLARAYYLSTTKLTPEQLAERDLLFGSLRDGLRPLDGYLWGEPAPGLVEIPVSTIPFCRVPAHLSYMLYLRTFSSSAARMFAAASFRMYRIANTSPSLLLHTLDFLGADDTIKDLEFFPAMKLRTEDKLPFVRSVLRSYREQFDVVTMAEHARAMRVSSPKTVDPVFFHPPAPTRRRVPLPDLEEAACSLNGR